MTKALYMVQDLLRGVSSRNADTQPPGGRLDAAPLQITAEAASSSQESERHGEVLNTPLISHRAVILMGRWQAIADLKTAAPFLLIDITIALCAGVAGAATIEFRGGQASVAWAPGLAALVVLLHLIQGAYPSCGITGAAEFRRSVRTVFATITITALAVLTAAHLPVAEVGLGWLVSSALLAVFLPPARPVLRRLLSNARWWTQPAVLVTTPANAADDLERLHRNRREGVRPAGLILTPAPGQALTPQEEIETLGPWANRDLVRGPFTDLERVLRSARASRLVVAAPEAATHTSPHVFRGIPHVTFSGSLTLNFSEKATLVDHAGIAAVHRNSRLTCPWSLLSKRLLDLGLVLAAAPLWLPLMALIAVAIKCTSRGPIFYRQARVGRFCQPFQAFKFRSMVQDADQKLVAYLTAHPELQAEWDATHKLQNDPRVTAVGRFLRRSSLDELPQLWNVFIGEMSLVGPRPIIDSDCYDRQYIDNHPEVFSIYQMVRPGITGLWQVSGRNRTHYVDRIHYDEMYFNSWSVSLDLYLLWRTIKTALLREGAC